MAIGVGYEGELNAGIHLENHHSENILPSSVFSALSALS